MPLPGLKALRRRRAMTQRELAERAEVMQDIISQLETGRRGAYPRTTKRLCTALQVAPEELIRGSGAEQ
ncbi:MAG: helix-turn-helix domain-containing protein [Actinomycetota bacterium]|nr:helix-turn-helix domain-containing protein [Actinomycetota bacterium]